MNIYAKNLTKYFNKNIALNNVNLDIEARRIIVIGQNGSGKSTLLSIVYGLLRPSGGILRVNGYEPYRERERAAHEMTIAFEKPYFDINIKVQDIYQIISNYYSYDCAELFWDEIGIKKYKDVYISNLSSGQKQMIQLMQALCRESAVKVLDEPFSHLDVININLIGEYIIKSKFDVILTTHIPEEAEWIGDYFIVLDNGRVMWHGRINELNEEGTYEVYLRYGVPDTLNVYARLGYVAIVRSSINELVKLLIEGRIRGFKRLGVRKYFSS